VLLVASAASAQDRVEIPPELLQAVMPGAHRFGPKEGQPPVLRAFATDSTTGQEALIGYLFLTSDLPPEEMGYNGPIEVLVGVDLHGTLTGARVVDYYESLRRSDGDFLRRRGFQEQFQGKHLADPFRVRRDVDGISGATITVAAMARGIRNAARRVAAAYMTHADKAGPLTADELDRLSWLELAVRGRAQRIQIAGDGISKVELSLMRIQDEAMGRALLGQAAWDRVLEQAADRAAERHFWLVGVDGGLEALFRPQVLFLVRASDTLRFTTPDLITLGEPRAGKLDGQFRSHGVLLVDSAVDIALPFTWILDFGTSVGADSVLYPGDGSRPVVARVAPAAAPPAVDARADRDTVAATRPVITDTGTRTGAARREPVSAQAESVSIVGASPASDTADAAATTQAPAPLLLDFAGEEDETVLARTLGQTSWVRFGLLVLLLALAMAAFFSKRVGLRWLVLGGTLIVLGFGGVGFLSVSHITSAIKVGPAVFLEDLPLLLFVTFTVLTTLLWGRVFCGHLCPFGALQDFLDRIIPERFKRQLPAGVHRRALLVKYGVLALVIVPAVAGSNASVFEYVEPFGTVFFLSPSIGLWTIAAALLLASAMVPRFYCRYACPLGASLALASILSPLRIRRVEQCTVCKVCEQDCPTGAITGPTIDFKECVRCNVCETNLIERTGVCGHDMADVRSQLVQLQVRGRRGGQRGH
jgi:ferredoxin